MFRALLLDKDESGTPFARITDVDDAILPEGVLVDVEYSTLNYKDGLAITNASPIVRSWPMIPGIDFAGRRADTNAPVVLTGWGVGESHPGGLAQKASVPEDWLVELPDGLSTARAAAIGTAGFTAMLCVMALQAHDIVPESGPVVVTGAAGGVGSVAVALLAGAGYEVHASTGRPEEADYLHMLGASTLVSRDELSGPARPLGKTRWAGAVDAVGSHTLANVLSMTKEDGCVAACGLAQGMDLPSFVAPFILRGVTLAGINSVSVPHARRVEAWRRLAGELPAEKLDAMTQTVPLGEVIDLASKILAGQVRGRIVVDVNA